MKIFEADEALQEQGLSLREWIRTVAADPEVSQADAVRLLRELTGIEVATDTIRNWTMRFGYEWTAMPPGSRNSWPERTEGLRQLVRRCLVGLMEMKGFRQVDLAEACDVSRQAVQQWMCGDVVPPPRALDYLLEWDEEEEVT